MPTEVREFSEEALDEETHRQILSYLQELESNLERQAVKLRDSEKRYKDLFEAEQKRSRELALLTEVGESALTTDRMEDYLESAAKAIQRNFSYYDVAMFLVAENDHTVVLRSQSGGYRGVLPLGYRQKIGEGIIGWVAEHGETLLANDVSQEPRFLQAFPDEALTRSEIAVPIKVGNVVRGVIDVQSQSLDAFDYRDVVILQTVADQMATAIENVRLYHQTLLLKELNEAVIASFPSAVIVIDGQRRVVLVNRMFCQQTGLTEGEAEGRNLGDVLDPDLLRETRLLEAVQSMLETGESVELADVTCLDSYKNESVVEIRLSFLSYGEESLVLITLRDVTMRARRTARMALLHSMGNLLQRTLDLDHLLFTVLTCVTAGPALGFNRAFLLLLDKDKENLQGEMAVGPGSPDEAGRIWLEVGQHYRNLEELVQAFDAAQTRNTPIQQLVERMRLNLTESREAVLARAVNERTSFKVQADCLDPAQPYPYCEVVQAPEFAVAPLVAGTEVLGLVLTDNVFSGKPIEDEDLQLLTILCNQAGLAIANALAHEEIENHAAELTRAYQQLKETQQDLVHSEKLATVGEMAARVSHEIRNPLATIGGFARSVLKKPDDVERVKHDASVIVEEVEELEEILMNLLDLTRPSQATRRLESVNVVVEHSCLMLRDDLEKHPSVTLVKELDPNIPEVSMDSHQLQQAALNILRNGIQAMPDGGTLSVRTHAEEGYVTIAISDSGVGIPETALSRIFMPFYTTKIKGTGLGLAVTKKTIEDHCGCMEVTSEENRGTTFTLHLPLIAREGTEQSEQGAA
ncbi:MAG: GAF domain-containing protein [Armatimonadetes bacterium]|nr:GAF domain-containing protein [Armatimonadota bacterium]